jgi:hypothetical protein
VKAVQAPEKAQPEHETVNVVEKMQAALAAHKEVEAPVSVPQKKNGTLIVDAEDEEHTTIPIQEVRESVAETQTITAQKNESLVSQIRSFSEKRMNESKTEQPNEKKDEEESEPSGPKEEEVQKLDVQEASKQSEELLNQKAQQQEGFKLTQYRLSEMKEVAQQLENLRTERDDEKKTF